MRVLAGVSWLLPLCYSPKLCQDAYLAAFAVAADLSLVTFDEGFSDFAS